LPQVILADGRFAYFHSIDFNDGNPDIVAAEELGIAPDVDPLELERIASSQPCKERLCLLAKKAAWFAVHCDVTYRASLQSEHLRAINGRT
jgi:hypothetical protein